jgi:hypothetical protein
MNSSPIYCLRLFGTPFDRREVWSFSQRDHRRVLRLVMDEDAAQVTLGG